MPDGFYGVIVEGPYDAAVYTELLRKILPTIDKVISRPTGGKTQLLRLLPGLLRELEHALAGHPVDKVLVIRDTNGKDAEELEKGLADRVRGRAFSFRKAVQFHAIRRTVET